MAPQRSTGRACVFFDDGRGVLGPLTDLRASFEVRTGALTSAERHRRVLGLEPIALYVPAALAGVVAERSRWPVNQLPASASNGPVLAINGRCVLPPDVLSSLEPGQAAVESASGDLIAACVEARDVAGLIAGDDAARERVEVEARVLLQRPWDVIAFRDRAIDVDLGVLVSQPQHDAGVAAAIVGGHPVRVASSARVWPGVVLDAEGGPIMIEAEAVIRPGAVIVGPAFIGRGSVVAEHCVIRAHSVIGPVCKVGGEISGAIMQCYSNKAHDGFLGDSWVGEWVNLGAGTTTSNLLNTYSEISAVADRGMSRERTGLQFFGGIFGDHVKTAIGTRSMGGSIVSTGAMWAASAAISDFVGRFAWMSDAGLKLYRLPRFVQTMEAMMGRRRVTPGAAYRRRVEELHQAAS